MKLIKLFYPDKPKGLKDYLLTEITDDLIPVEMPNVGTYQPGPRTKIKMK